MSAKKPKKEEVKPEVATVSFLDTKTALVVHDDAGRAKFPRLSEGMAPQHKDGKLIRQRGTLRLRHDGSMLNLTLQMPTEGVQTSLDVESLVDCLDALEAHLCSGKAVWKEIWTDEKKVLPKV